MSVPGGRALPGSEITAAASAAAFFVYGKPPARLGVPESFQL